MPAKGFVCEADINLHLLSTLGNHECPSQFVYITLEIFGKLHTTKPQHAYYPLVFNETIHVEKTFWSPYSEDEVLDMLSDSQVIVELRRIDPCFYNGILLAYFDGTVKDLLFSPYPRIPCSTNGREMYLNRTIDFKGSSPRLRYSAFADIKKIGGDTAANTINRSMYSSTSSRIDDGYYSPSHSLKDVSFKSAPIRQSRSPKRAPSPTATDHASSPYYSRQTVASAIRSRSPSPVCNNRSSDKYDEKDYLAAGDSGGAGGNEKLKEPFVVRKVPDNLILRNPKLHDALPKPAVRRGRSRRRQSVTRNQKETTSAHLPRYRSASPTKHNSKGLGSGVDLADKIDDQLAAYRPSTTLATTNLRSSHDWPHHHCMLDCTSRCHSPLFDYYSDKLARLSRCSYSCHSHCCHC